MGGPGFDAGNYAKPEGPAKKVVKAAKEPKKKAATKDKAKAKTKKAQ